MAQFLVMVACLFIVGGYEPGGPTTLQPRKKPRGRELPAYSLAINKVINRVRVTVEHAIAGVKRCRSVADTFRNWRVSFGGCGDGSGQRLAQPTRRRPRLR